MSWSTQHAGTVDAFHGAVSAALAEQMDYSALRGACNTVANALEAALVALRAPAKVISGSLTPAGMRLIIRSMYDQPLTIMSAIRRLAEMPGEVVITVTAVAQRDDGNYTEVVLGRRHWDIVPGMSADTAGMILDDINGRLQIASNAYKIMAAEERDRRYLIR